MQVASGAVLWRGNHRANMDGWQEEQESWVWLCASVNRLTQSGQICATPAWLALIKGYKLRLEHVVAFQGRQMCSAVCWSPKSELCNQCQRERVLLPFFLTLTAEGRWNARLGIPVCFSTNGVTGAFGDPQLCSVLLCTSGTAVC